MNALTDRIRAQQARPRLTSEQIMDALDRHLAAHMGHAWHQVGRCVYCGPCSLRLYQGTLPKDHEVWVPPPRQYRPTAADEMRRRWGK